LDAVVPAGRLREPLSAAARASMVLITRADDPAGVGLVLDRLRGVIDRLPPPAQLVFRAEGLVSLTKSETRPPQWCRGRTAVLCSGIGHAPSFRAMAESLGLRVLEELVYADHHRYTDKDVGRIRARASALQADLIVTTEKDAGKLSSRLDDAENHWWAVRLGVEFIAGEERLRRLLEGEGQTLATRGRVR
jgi:tetraacyldisaccharide 4'-kinase